MTHWNSIARDRAQPDPTERHAALARLRCSSTWRVVKAPLLVLAFSIACSGSAETRMPVAKTAAETYRRLPNLPHSASLVEIVAPVEVTPRADPAPLPLAGAGELAVWRDGEQMMLSTRDQAEEAGLFVLDLGTDWVPALLRSSADLPHDYEPMFIELANGRFDDGPDGRRARRARYLEPHGIPPTPELLRARFEVLAQKPCAAAPWLQPLRELEPSSWESAAEFPEVMPQVAIDALQQRLVCESHLRSAPTGRLDAETRDALEEFARRNRIYARPELQGEILDALREEPLELERAALVRVLTERLVLELGVIEDHSARDSAPARDDAPVAASPDVVRRVEARVVETFGLQTIEGVRAFYARLRDAIRQPHYEVGLDPIELPDYYGSNMDLWVEIDRGDLYYEFPFRPDGTPIEFEIERGPTLTLFARDSEQQVRPLATYRTTIGGWRIRHHDGQEFWEYKPSPVGSRVWARVISAPVWLPPAATPPESLVVTLRRTIDGSEYRELNHSLIGPSFGSVYGLVAAHHRRYGQTSDGGFEVRGDDGIRTHGSSDYTSIWRLSSNGCHRLHNHLALRLFNFILAHRSHRREGHQPAYFRRTVIAEDFRAKLAVKRTGYAFVLDEPIPVRVLRGRVLGALQRPIRERIPVGPELFDGPLTLTPGDFAEGDPALARAP